MALGVACHCAILSIDHMGEIITKHGQGSVIGNMKLHRTKCACLIKNVIAPTLKEELNLLKMLWHFFGVFQDVFGIFLALF